MKSTAWANWIGCQRGRSLDKAPVLSSIKSVVGRQAEEENDLVLDM